MQQSIITTVSCYSRHRILRVVGMAPLLTSRRSPACEKSGKCASRWRRNPPGLCVSSPPVILVSVSTPISEMQATSDMLADGEHHGEPCMPACRTGNPIKRTWLTGEAACRRSQWALLEAQNAKRGRKHKLTRCSQSTSQPCRPQHMILDTPDVLAHKI